MEGERLLSSSSSFAVAGSPTVSIVIPAYNRARLLPACIDSALAQDHPSFEVIVIDDGSEDETPEVCRRYGGRITYLRKANGGTASALNAGIRLMKGKWFKWLSSDDMLEPTALSVLLSSDASSEAGVLYGDYLEVNLSGEVIRMCREKTFASQQEFVVELWRHFVGSAAGALIRRSCFERVGPFDESLRYAEDYDWWLRAALVHGVEFRHVPATVARYRVHPGQTMSQKKERAVKMRRQIRSRVAQLLGERGTEDPALFDYYRQLTLRFQKISAPLFPLGPRTKNMPRATTAFYWFEKLAPRWSSVLYWAANPPLPTVEGQAS